MKILRLSFFNLRKNKREAAAILFLTLISSFLLGTFFSSVANIPKVFDKCFEETGCADSALRINADKYRDDFYGILADDFGIGDIRRGSMLYATGVQITRDDKTYTMNLNFVTESTERKFESFVKCSSLSESEIEKLEHPIWLTEYFMLNDGYEPGDTFTIIAGGRDYPFEIAGFYKCGLFADAGYGRKCVLSDRDYLLLSAVYGEEEVLVFNGGERFDYSEYTEKCREATSENMSQICRYWSKKDQMDNETGFIMILIYLSVFFSSVNIAAVIFLIGHKITKDIEDQMQQIGVLEALGYTSKEISLSYACEYVLSGGAGSLTGAAAAVFFTPVMNGICTYFISRRYDCPPSLLRIIAAALTVAALTAAFAVMRSSKIRKIPPVSAFRKGIKSHHFGKNLFPLERLKKSINLRLALKGIFTDLSSNIGMGSCMILAGTAILFCASTYSFFADSSAIFAIVGAEVSDESVTLMNGVDARAFREDLLTMPEVRKVNLTAAFSGDITVKDSEEPGGAFVYDDYNETEFIHTKYGRFAKYDNEIMITLRRSVTEHRSVGDRIVIECDGGEKSYIITGIVPSTVNNRMDLYFTTQGFIRAFPNVRPNSADIYLNKGCGRKDFEKKLTALYGVNAKDTAYSAGSGGTLEERIKAAADEKMAVLISQYGVTDVDYAVKIGDSVIKGNSSSFVIKEMSSPSVELSSSLEQISSVTKAFCLGAVIFVSIVVAVILSIISAGAVKRQRRDLGIMKSMGYTSKDLMIQIALRILPAAVISAAAALLLTTYVNKCFWFAVFGVMIQDDLPVMISTAAAMVIFCLLVSYISAGRIKKISVTELMTE